MNEELLGRAVAGGMALMGAGMIFFNKRWAADVLHNRRLWRERLWEPRPSDDSRLENCYRVAGVVAGLFFLMFGLLGVFGVIGPRQ